MNRKQIVMTLLAVVLFVGSGTALAFNIKTKPKLITQPSSESGFNTSTTKKQSTSNTNNQTPSEAPLSKPSGSSSQPKTASPSSNPTPNSPAPTTTPNSYVPPVVETCPDYLRASYTDTYNANTAAENSNYQNNINSIKAYWNSRGLLYSGAAQAELAAEDQRHQSALSSIENNYQQQLSNSNCS